MPFGRAHERLAGGIRAVLTRRGLLIGGGLAAAGLGGGVWAVRQRMGTMTGYAAAVEAMRKVPAVTPDFRDLIRFAMLAPNSHNTQPWRFRPRGNEIAILPDFTRRTPVVDPDDHHIFVSLGAAAETLALKAGAAGLAGGIEFDATGDGAVLVRFGSGNGNDTTLSDAIVHRQSTRADYDGTGASASDLRLLAVAATVPGVDLVLVTDRPQMDRIGDLVIAGNTAQIGDPAFLAELKHWLRFNPAAALRTGDGLFSAASGNPALPDWLGPWLFDRVFTVKAETARYASHVASSAGLAVFAGEQADRAHWVQVGRACQRFALQATALGLKTAFLNQPVEVPGLRPELAALIGLPGRRPDIVMRFGRGAALPFSARRPVDAVIV
jgi:hypothetical protein